MNKLKKVVATITLATSALAANVVPALASMSSFSQSSDVVSLKNVKANDKVYLTYAKDIFVKSSMQEMMHYSHRSHSSHSSHRSHYSSY